MRLDLWRRVILGVIDDPWFLLTVLEGGAIVIMFCWSGKVLKEWQKTILAWKTERETYLGIRNVRKVDNT